MYGIAVVPCIMQALFSAGLLGFPILSVVYAFHSLFIPIAAAEPVQ